MAAFPPEFTDDCTRCRKPVDGPDVACASTWEVTNGHAEPSLTCAAVWCDACHEAGLCDCS